MYPRHTQLVIGYYKNKPVLYSMGNIETDYNFGDDDVIVTPKGRGLNTPEKVLEMYKSRDQAYKTKLDERDTQKWAVSFGLTAPQNKTPEYWERKKILENIEKGVNVIIPELQDKYHVPASTLNRLAQYLPGIANAESNFKAYDKERVWTDNSAMGTVKQMGKLADSAYTRLKNTQKTSNEYQEPIWKLEVAAKKLYPNDYNKYQTELKRLKTINEQKLERDKYVTYNNSFTNPVSIMPNSVGPFSIKEVRPALKDMVNKGDLYGMNSSQSDEYFYGSQAALAILAENYFKVKSKYPDLSEAEAVEAAVVGYNSPNKMTNPEFVDHYIRRSTRKPGEVRLNSDYLNKIKSFDPLKY
jgi:hypothetical protein